MNKQSQLKFVAERALASAHLLPPSQQADLFLGVSHLLKGPERKAARDAAFHIREAEHAQLTLGKLLHEAQRQ